MNKGLVLIGLVICLAIQFTLLAKVWNSSAELVRLDKKTKQIEIEIYGAPITKRPLWKVHAMTVFVTIVHLAAAGVMIYRVVVWL